ncbi:hypothetical protein U9M48_038535 [Paspalum notatum var. saurae]|uniref:PWWP domain-containing protein n=1 Tax=Paspalum notatum var. saurae TaxID=547442 RepID=A0AAQ3XDN6_PASNO
MTRLPRNRAKRARKRKWCARSPAGAKAGRITRARWEGIAQAGKNHARVGKDWCRRGITFVPLPLHPSQSIAAALFFHLSHASPLCSSAAAKPPCSAHLLRLLPLSVAPFDPPRLCFPASALSWFNDFHTPTHTPLRSRRTISAYPGVLLLPRLSLGARPLSVGEWRRLGLGKRRRRPTRRFASIIMVNENAEKDHGINPENKLRHNFRLGDITWVKCSGSSWWPAQVIDESCVGSKPKKKEKDDCLVRLYGTCQYLYVDPWKSISEFKMMLKQENKSAMEAFREVLEKELSCVNSCNDYEEEAANSEGGATKGTSKKTSSRKVRNQEGLMQQHKEEEDQEVRSTTTGVTDKKRKSERARQSNSARDAVGKDCNEISDEGLSNKRQKHVPQRASVGRREALRRSDATGDSMLDETLAPHAEIKTMVRDILFKDIIDKEHDAEMAFVDEVINGICNAAEGGVMVGGAASTEGGVQGVRQTGSGVEGESSNFTQRRRDETGDDALQLTSPKTMKGNVGVTSGSSGEGTGAT